MIQYHEEIPETVELPASSLFSRHGFCDGDLLEWLYEFGQFDRRAVLVEAVRRHLLPVVTPPVEIEVILSNHNPCRALRVNGVDVTGLVDVDEIPFRFAPEYVSVPGDVILALAHEMADVNLEQLVSGN